MLSLGKCIGKQKIEVLVVSLLYDLFLEICILPIYGFTWHFVAMSYILLLSTNDMLPWHVNPRPRWQFDQETHSNDAYPIIVNAQ